MDERTDPDAARSTDAVTAPDDLVWAVTALATTDELLVAADYDGTLAEIVDDPQKALPNQESLRLLGELAALPRTHVAIVSGRSRVDLVRLTDLGPGVHLIGSHGSEFDAEWADLLPDSVQELRGVIVSRLEEVAASVPGSFVEIKPTSAAFHYRTVADADVADAERWATEVAHEIDGAIVKNGKRVVEVCALSTDKGTALERLATRLRTTATVFVGDDDTDEDAFAVLGPSDLGVKVGPGPTAAAVRVTDPTAVELLLAHLLQLRSAGLTS